MFGSVYYRRGFACDIWEGGGLFSKVLTIIGILRSLLRQLIFAISGKPLKLVAAEPFFLKR